MLSREFIREQARKAHRELSRHRHDRDLWPHPPSDLEMIEPEKIIRLRKIRLLEPVEIRSQRDLTEHLVPPRYAGYMNPRRNIIAVAQNLSLEVRRFTMAHELGHHTLHWGRGVLFRDPPLSGAQMGERDSIPVEREADCFAAEFLMPEWLVREAFFSYFGVSSFEGLQLTQDVAFHLSTWGARQETLANLKQRGQRYFSLKLAGSRRWVTSGGSESILTLCQLFRVSRIAMAIQLESLRLV